MQKVSKAYKESMESALRERGYIMITFGLVNQDLQAKATITNGNFAWYSHSGRQIFSNKLASGDYASLEENFSKVNNSMRFLPRESEGNTVYDYGIVSQPIISSGVWSLTIEFNTIATDFKGLTIDFGDNYPVSFDVVSNTGQVAQFRNNTKSEWSTDTVFPNTTSLTLKVYQMKNIHSRCRIHYIMFGYGLMFSNDKVVDSSLETVVSPIGATVPQIDFSVTLDNNDHYFNVDNPNSAINYLETGQEMDVAYGYETPGADEIEWIQGQHLWCSEWESNDSTATIKCQDILRNMDSTFDKGQYSEKGKSFYDLAVEQVQAAGVKKYYIDPRLKKLYTKNPMPRVTSKEALQIIANACRCVLTQSRTGQVQIKSNFIPEYTLTSNGEERYSNLNATKTDSTKSYYATMAQNYSVVNNGMFFLPREASNIGYKSTGYVSKAISDANGRFSVNPTITMSLEAIRTYFGMHLKFGGCVPSQMYVRAYLDNALVNSYRIESRELSEDCTIYRDFDDCNKIQLEFVRTSVPYNRIVLDYFTLNEVADFTMTKDDMQSSPTAIKQELVKEVVVPCYSYQQNSKEDNVVYQDVDVTAGESRTYYIQEPNYGYSVKLDDQLNNGAEIVESGAYYVTVKFSKTGSFKLDVTGHQYKVVTRNATRTLHATGKTVTWSNPLISDMQMAEDLATWLADYYLAGMEYEYDSRGNPELDATDTIYQENEFIDKMTVNVYHTKLNFDNSFSGHIIARRTGR